MPRTLILKESATQAKKTHARLRDNYCELAKITRFFFALEQRYSHSSDPHYTNACTLFLILYLTSLMLLFFMLNAGLIRNTQPSNF